MLMFKSEQEFVIRGIEYYIHRFCPRPAPVWPKKYFLYRSYVRWAADEAIDYVLVHKYISPMIALEEFLKKLDNFSCSGKDVDVRYIFSIAYDTVQDIIDFISYVYCGGINCFLKGV